MHRPVPFNPLDRRNLAASATEALLEKRPVPLGNLEPFYGAGVYALYYDGDFGPYKRIKEANSQHNWLLPIYVGKAIPKGARKGVLDDDLSSEPYLKRRLDEHAESIRSATTTLSIDDFHVRYLVVEDIWIPLVESLMISHFMPIWNNPLEGFGNHDTGAGRYNGYMPRWDVMHPGRKWAPKCKQRPETQQLLISEVTAILDARALPKSSKLFRE
jgi:hypothetical protein